MKPSSPVKKVVKYYCTFMLQTLLLCWFYKLIHSANLSQNFFTKYNVVSIIFLGLGPIVP